MHEQKESKTNKHHLPGIVVGTPSGGSSQEDPPTGGSTSSTGKSSNQDGVMCDFSILRHKIIKENSPLYENFKGNIYSYLPFKSKITENEGKKIREEYKIQKPGQIIRSESYGLHNNYMSELIFLYNDSKKKGKFRIKPVEYLKRNRVFLSQTFWFVKDKVSRWNQDPVKVSEYPWQGRYIIHEIRPLYQMDDWAASQTTNNCKIDTIAAPLESDQNHWLVVVRPPKDELKETHNKYAIGVVSTPQESNGDYFSIPQLSQDVTVYDYDEGETDTSTVIKIRDKHKVRATLQIVPKITLSTRQEHFNKNN